jgi:hypothetical protein
VGQEINFVAATAAKKRVETAAIAVVLSSLDPKFEFRQCCETIAVSNRGCLIRSSRPMPTGIAVRLESPTGNATALGRVILSVPLEEQDDCWQLGITLEADQAGVHPLQAFAPNAESSSPTDVPPLGATTQQLENSTPALGTKEERANATSAETQAAVPSESLHEVTSPSERPNAEQVLERLLETIREKLDFDLSLFRSNLQDAAVEVLDRSRSELESQAISQLEQLRTEVQSSVVLVRRELEEGKTILKEANEACEKLRSLTDALEDRIAEVQHSMKNADREVGQRVHGYMTFIKETVLEAQEQFTKHSAESMQQNLEKFEGELLTKIEKVPQISEELIQRVDEATARLAEAADKSGAAIDEELSKLSSEKLTSVDQEIDSRIERAAAKLEASLVMAIESFCGALRKT